MTASDRRRLRLFLLALVLPFLLFRLFLHASPESNLDVGGYNVHHLFTGLLLITAGGVPLAVRRSPERLLDLCAAVFGVGLSLALDEWVYLIVTDGSDASYLLPVSLWGGAVMVGTACAYALLAARRPDTEVSGPDTGVSAGDTCVSVVDTGVAAPDTEVAAPDPSVAAPPT